MRYVKCNKCGHTAPEDDFPKARDFLQAIYIAECPKCDNHQSPGNASIRMFDGDRPFVFVRELEIKVSGPEVHDALPTVMHRATEAS
jgi:NAD-dependent SIR2 family protein deacetylase